MTTNTVLTDKDRQKLKSDIAITKGERLFYEIVDAVEQAVLQSPEVRALREDSERYRALRKMNWFDSPLCVVSNPQKSLKLGAYCPSVDMLDAAIDAAMEAKP